MPVKYKKYWVDKQYSKGEKLGHYSPNQRLEAVKTWLTLGSLVQTAAVVKIPEQTLRIWKRSDWWKELEAEFKSQGNVELSAKLRDIAKRSIDVIHDRLEKGDIQINPRTGAITRRPVGARIAADILNKSLNQKVIVDKIEEKPAVDPTRIEDRLKVIQAKMMELSRYNESKTINGEVIKDEGSPSSNQEFLPEVVGKGDREGEAS